VTWTAHDVNRQANKYLTVVHPDKLGHDLCARSPIFWNEVTKAANAAKQELLLLFERRAQTPQAWQVPTGASPHNSSSSSSATGRTTAASASSQGGVPVFQVPTGAAPRDPSSSSSATNKNTATPSSKWGSVPAFVPNDYERRCQCQGLNCQLGVIAHNPGLVDLQRLDAGKTAVSCDGREEYVIKCESTWGAIRCQAIAFVRTDECIPLATIPQAHVYYARARANGLIHDDTTPVPWYKAHGKTRRFYCPGCYAAWTCDRSTFQLHRQKARDALPFSI